jgi:hypothetical protein
MWTEPTPLFECVRLAFGFAFALVGHPAFCFPLHAVPRARHLVFRFVTAKGDPQTRIIAVCDTPLGHLVGHVERVDSVAVWITVRRIGIGGIKENGACLATPKEVGQSIS